MRVVFDTNVIVSAFLWHGLPEQALDIVRAKRVTLISSAEIRDELQTVFSRAKFAKRIAEAGQTPAELTGLYEDLVEMVEPAAIGNVVLADPKDDKFLACAIGGKAILVVSGDHHLLTLGKYQEVEILTVQQFLERVQSDETT